MTALDLEALADMAAEADEETEVEVDETPVDGEMSARGAKIEAQRRAKLDAIFAGKHYTIVKEFNIKGKLDKEGNQLKVESPLGNKLTKGYTIKLDDEFTPEPGYEARLLFGERVLLEAQRTYGAIEMPESVVKSGAGRPRKSAAEKAAEEQEKKEAKAALMEMLAAELGF